MLSLGFGPLHSSPLLSWAANGSSARECRQEWRMKGFARASSSLGGRGLSEVEEAPTEEDFQLDSSVFEEVFPSSERVVRPVGTRPRNLPVPQSTLIPDDWKGVQQYYHRSKKERKDETMALQLEWAKRRVAEKRAATHVEIENEQRFLRGEELSSGDEGDSSGEVVEMLPETQVDGTETGLGETSVVSGRARPKDFRGELELSSIEDIAQSLRKEDVEVEQSSERDSEEAPVQEETFSLTPVEKAILRSRNLNFATISSGIWSPLHTLAASGQVYLAAELLKKGASIDAVDEDGLTPLHRAVQSGRKTMIRMLLQAGANAQVLDSRGATLLHYSAQIGNHEISKLLLRHGVDVNIPDKDGWTPLHVAVQSGRLELIKALVYRGADISFANKDGNTALDLALGFGGCFRFYNAIKFLKKRSVFDHESTSNRDADDELTV